jgi:hypothetical protein
VPIKFSLDPSAGGFEVVRVFFDPDEVAPGADGGDAG